VFLAADLSAAREGLNIKPQKGEEEKQTEEIYKKIKKKKNIK
jgi:hypothetical protein